MSAAKLTVAEFMIELSRRARYGIRGEKPIALIAALQYVYRNRRIAKRLVELFNDPQHSLHVRKTFIDLANQFGRISEPSTSWNVITGKNREIQKAITQFPDVDMAFSKLTLEEVKSLSETFVQRLEKAANKASKLIEGSNVIEKEVAKVLFTYSFKNAEKILGSILADIEKAIKEASSCAHDDLVKSFSKLGWNTEFSLLGRYRCDAWKEGISVEIEATDKSSVIDVVHRDFFRFWILYRMDKIKAGVIITRAMGGEVNFQKIKSELKLYGDYYEVPLYIIGLHAK